MSTSQQHPIRHFVLAQFKASATADSIAAAVQQFSTIPSAIPDILYYQLSTVIPADAVPQGHMTHPDGFTHVLDSLFPSAEALHVYENHAAHKALTQQLIPLIEKLLSIDVEMPGLDVDAFLKVQHAPHVHHLTLIRPNHGVHRAHIDPTLHRWGALPAVIPELVWASAGHAADKPLYEGWHDMTKGYSVVCDVVGRDLPSMADFSQHPKHAELAPHVMQVTDVEKGGLVAVDWQL